MVAVIKETSRPMRPDASPDAICEWQSCAKPFKKRKRWQRFHSPECRHAFHASQGDGAMRGVVKSVRVLKRGEVSVILRFGIEAREDVLKLEPGVLAEVSAS